MAEEQFMPPTPQLEQLSTTANPTNGTIQQHWSSLWKSEMLLKKRLRVAEGQRLLFIYDDVQITHILLKWINFYHTVMYLIWSELKPMNSGLLRKLDQFTDWVATKTETSKYKKICNFWYLATKPNAKINGKYVNHPFINTARHSHLLWVVPL